MEQANIAMLKLDKSSIKNINVQFNPSDYSTSKSSNYTVVKSSDGSKTTQFVSEGSDSLKLKLTVDGFTKADTLDAEQATDVIDDVNFFRELITIHSELHIPPLCKFSWGSFSFLGYVKSLSINYTMFASSGKPIRATVDLTIEEFIDQKKPLESPDRTKRKILTQDTPLYTVAHDAYDDPSQWRLIAVANGIKNPRKLPAGMVLKVPPKEFS